MAATLRDDFEIAPLNLRSFVHLNSKEVEMVRLWRNDEKTRRFLYKNSEIGTIEHANFIKTLHHSSAKGYWLAYEETTPLGVISLTQFSHEHKRSYLGIYTDPKKQGAGIGKKLMKALITLAFEHFYLHALRLEVLEANMPAMRLYEGLGFAQEGALRDYLSRDGAYHDVIIMSLINPKSSDFRCDYAHA